MAVESGKSETYGDKDAATILKAARIAAGFRSAAAAAAHFGWSADTLRGHESGARNISEIDAEKYAASFGVSVRQLLKADESGKSETYGDKDAATILKAARIAAGFRSAAAAHFGWSADTLRGHESGARNISEIDAEKYAASFGVSVRQLLNPEVRLSRKAAQNLEKLRAGEARKVKDQRKRVGKRLRLARIVRGFPTLTSAAIFLGASRGTINNHETGANGLSERVAEAYGQAYGIEMSWLLRGTLPSGLGGEIDRTLAGSRGTDLEVLAKTLPTIPMLNPPNASSIQMLFLEAVSRSISAREGDGERLYEVDLADIAQLRQIHSAPSSRAWELPSGLLSKLIGSNAADVVVLAIPRHDPNWEIGDRLFVDRSKRDVSSGGLFAYLVDGLRIEKYHRGQPPLTYDPEALIGKVVASFASHRDEPPEMTEARRRLLPF